MGHFSKAVRDRVLGPQNQTHQPPKDEGQATYFLPCAGLPKGHDATHPNGSWSGRDSLGGAIIGNPAVAVNDDGRLEVFVAGKDSAQ